MTIANPWNWSYFHFSKAKVFLNKITEVLIHVLTIPLLSQFTLRLVLLHLILLHLPSISATSWSQLQYWRNVGSLLPLDTALSRKLQTVLDEVILNITMPSDNIDRKSIKTLICYCLLFHYFKNEASNGTALNE